MGDSSYLVPYEEYATDRFEEKRSKFIGELFRVETPEQAVEAINQVKAKYRDARHHCYAYIIREGNYMRYSDDGEPQGTAGMPILEVLRHAGVTNVCCVVTRYFGGILLGTGGLARAYTKGAQIALKAAGLSQMDRYSQMLLSCPYSLLDSIQKILPEHDATVEETDYGADVTLTIALPEGGEDALNTALMDASAGQVSAEYIESRFMGRKVEPSAN
ncbi:MAG: YigZ family protein [Eubacteriales bacterium]|nr:YigZ family protein [Eubacteriales bacterium]